MTTPRQAAANRLNALRSTGPGTPEGKAVSAQNNRKLGLAAAIFDVLPCESQPDFDDYAATLQAEYRPKTLIEKTLVLKLAQHYWLGQRAVRAQNTCFHFPLAPVVENQSLMRQLALYLRYQAHHDRAFHKCLAELGKIQQKNSRQEIHAVRLAKKSSHSPEPSVALPPATVPPGTVLPATAIVITEAA